MLSALTVAMEQAIKASQSQHVLPPHTVHTRVKELYTWQDVARRTEIVYDRIQEDEEIHLEGRIQK